MSVFTADNEPCSLDSLDSIPSNLVSPLHSSSQYDTTIPYSLGTTTVTLDLPNTDDDDDDSTVTINIEDNSSLYDYNIASLNSASTVLYDYSLTIPKTV
jgi:hypothetical protein